MSLPILYYIHDPMCSWCYAFRENWQYLTQHFEGKVEFVRLLGGLAADSDAPMDSETRQMVQQSWRRIEESLPDTHFNFDFWEQNQPRRSTYPACRAVIAARQLADHSYDLKMSYAIQDAYYRQAKNPSDIDVLCSIAETLNLDRDQFSSLLTADGTEQQLQQEIAQARSLGVDSYPSLVLQINEQTRWPIAINYQDVSEVIETIEMCLE
ncbi:MAG: DsbA family protein [Gammaproteobacteria bacterium]|nr:DsbA family protein [Gammaproteobacteria bacterium]